MTVVTEIYGLVIKNIRKINLVRWRLAFTDEKWGCNEALFKNSLP